MTPTIALLNGKRGVGTTSVIYHLAWMYADQGHKVLAVDLDPQADLSNALLDVGRLEMLWFGGGRTIYDALRPQIDGAQDVAPAHRESIAPNLDLIVGDLSLSRFEDELVLQWERCLARKESAFRVISAFHRCIQGAAEAAAADVVLVDLGPDLGAVNRAALTACHHVVVPVATDLFATWGLRAATSVVRQWQDDWQQRLLKNPIPEMGLANEVMRLAGYVIVERVLRLEEPRPSPDIWARRVAGELGTKFSEGSATALTPSWIDVIPDVYATGVRASHPAAHPASDPSCLGLLKWYGSLMPIAQEARKPIFRLRPADGALGAHASAVRDASRDYQELAARIAAATWRSGKASSSRS